MAKRAAAAAKLDRLAAGNKSVFDTDMNDIAELGIGMELYFLLIKYLSWAFFTMGIVSLPAIIVNYYGDGVTAKMVDPLQLAYASLGNQGVNPDIASDPSQCLPLGGIDCTGATVNTPFTTDPQKVAWIVTSSDAIYSFVFLVVYLLFRRRARRAIDTHQNEHLTPAKYAIFVRGLPPDATAQEVLEHFNSRYDPTQEEQYYPLWLGCCWGRRPRRIKHSLSKGAVNCSVVNNLDHLWRPDDLDQARPVTGQQPRLSTAGLARPSVVGQQARLSTASLARPSTVGQPRPLTGGPPGTPRFDTILAKQEEHQMYLGTWIAEVSIAHPTGGLLRTFLAMEVLTRKISEAQALVSILTQEKEQAELALQNWVPPPGKKNPPKKKPKSTFKKADELLLQATTKKLERLQAAMTKKTSKLKALKQANKQLQEQQKQEAEAAAAAAAATEATSTAKTKAKPKKKKAPDAKPFDLNACECAFVVFNNLESRRRCLQDYRRSNQWLPRKFQPKTLRFRDDKFPLTVLAAPEPSNILWENLEVTARSRRIRRSFTNSVTFLLLLLSGVIISAAQSAQQTFKDKAPPAGLCESTLPEIFYASPGFLDAKTSIAEFGVIDGPQELWNTFLPCRGFLTDFLAKNAFIVIASAVVVIVNIVLKSTLRGFASFERHTSESAKASAVALKMFAAQFLNTAIIVLVVNAALSLNAVPVIGELFRGKYSDFQRDWYPTVGMGVTMTMLINAIMPQCILLLQLCEKMDQLYAGPTFDLAVRYPMILNSVFVTLVFCGGSPVVKTAYDEALGETVLGLLPWATDGATNTEEMYNKLVAQATTFDPLGKNGFIVKLVFSFLLFGCECSYQFYATRRRKNVVKPELSPGDPPAIHKPPSGGRSAKVAAEIELTDIPTSDSVVLPGKEDGLNGAEPLVHKTSIVSTAWAEEQAPVPTEIVPKAPLSARPVPTEVVLPEFTDIFRKSVGPTFRPDAKLGFKRDSSRPAELVRYWKEETVSNGFHRNPGDPMRTWEAIQAPVKTYAIEANAKYRLAVTELVAASRRALTIAENPETPSHSPSKPEGTAVTPAPVEAVNVEKDEAPKDVEMKAADTAVNLG
ncbi:hypothetical protein JG688_00002848 [Phytophthora aleatoria]|uniref:CSC1/OSCA1-like 7TM region domain-containing protein n=1 Tax=Phytophthora aleatoria TaxID=2496075 RepID=A0A8J5JF50_9STRA|nr:hypothetical protein JG688_00002848 [Phytophthora aleatoria]